MEVGIEEDYDDYDNYNFYEEEDISLSEPKDPKKEAIFKAMMARNFMTVVGSIAQRTEKRTSQFQKYLKHIQKIDSDRIDNGLRSYLLLQTLRTDAIKQELEQIKELPPKHDLPTPVRREQENKHEQIKVRRNKPYIPTKSVFTYAVKTIPEKPSKTVEMARLTLRNLEIKRQLQRMNNYHKAVPAKTDSRLRNSDDDCDSSLSSYSLVERNSVTSSYHEALENRTKPQKLASGKTSRQVTFTINTVSRPAPKAKTPVLTSKSVEISTPMHDEARVKSDVKLPRIRVISQNTTKAEPPEPLKRAMTFDEILVKNKTIGHKITSQPPERPHFGMPAKTTISLESDMSKTLRPCNIAPAWQRRSTQAMISAGERNAQKALAAAQPFMQRLNNDAGRRLTVHTPLQAKSSWDIRR